MREAFPDWGGQKAFVTEIAAENPKDGSTIVAILPEFVVALDDTHRVLVTRSPLSDEGGRVGGGHPMPGAVGGYWFVARGGRWFVTRREDAMLWDGAMGEVGAIAPLDLGASHHAITVTNGDCHQGACTEWVDVIELAPDKSHLALGGLQLASRYDGFDGRCSDFLTGGKAALAVGPGDCVDISGKWHLEPNADAAWPDMVVTFTGHELARDPAASAVASKAVDETQVLRYKAGKYVPVSGRNPVHGF